ncbi:hypothetical protein WUBG_04397 [Wuchereria bancrofti]|uniref:G-protein coupled receptors family 1 profile domain-containing protein n=1 Tax=Wuchereria bancrofti TaxID=6293 RepID=J9ER73_WUCBA|nr:hypothetical protein WUBG_04397 [Wuchereria bancrofti]
MNNLERCQTVIIELPESSIVYDWLYAVHNFYSPIHTYLSIVLCILGAICNFCNIVVLTRKRMRTPVNMTLTAMACCDTVVLFSNLIYTTHYTLAAFANCHPKQWSYGWAVFLVCHAHLSLIGHSSSIWLSVMLALIRYMTLRSRRKVDVLRIHLRHSYMAIAFVVLFVTLMNTPNFLAYKIIEMKLGETCNITDTSNYDASAYVPGVSDLALEAHCLIFRMAFWISGTVFKMTPCLLLSSFVWLLMKILTRVQQNRLKLLYHSTRFYNGKYESKKKNRGQSKIDTAKTNTSIVYRADRTTRMLLTILCVFLITELPQGIMMVLSGILPEAFRRHIYNSLGDLLDLLSLCNSCTTFVIYCSMRIQTSIPTTFIFDYKLRWKLKRNYKESSSHSTTSASFKNAFELPRNALNRNIEGVCPAVTATSELPMESSMIWSQYAENNVPEKSNRNIGNMVNDEGPSLLHSSA